MTRVSRARRVAVLVHPHCLPPDNFDALPLRLEGVDAPPVRAALVAPGA
jgi:hypothetical protein